MHVIVSLPTEKDWYEYFLSQTKQGGAGFTGLEYQRGGGLGNVFRNIFKIVLPYMKRVGKELGNEALRTGALLASDIVAGQEIRKSAKDRVKAGTSNLLRKAANKLQNGGKRKHVKKTRGKRQFINRKKKAPKRKGLKNKKRKVNQLRSF